MKKRLASALFAGIMLFPLCVCPAFAETGGDRPARQEHSVERREFALYSADPSVTAEQSVPLFFADGVGDLPYMEIGDFVSLLCALYENDDAGTVYGIDLVKRYPVVTMTRESGYIATLDFDEDFISFMDYAAFLCRPEESTLLDLVTVTGYDSEKKPLLFQRDKEKSFERYGDVKKIDLASYGIDMFSVGEDCYVPLQTLNDIFLFPATENGLLYNGDAVFLANSAKMCDPGTGELTPLGEQYYSVPAGLRSDGLAEYSYNELCLVLDLLYGLKEPHDISGFRQLFWEIGFDEALSGNDPVDADRALRQFIDYYLDDLHSGFAACSPLAGPQEMEDGEGSASRKILENIGRYMSARYEISDGSVPGYEEVGNTAYITFDRFELLSDDARAYYGWHKAGEIPEDTLGLITHAHEQITREGSPIENVVLDLSCNVGGTADAAVFVLCWFLGDAQISVKDMASGALSTAVYRADINLDGSFDDRDSIADRNLYCLISPVSFSCGNLVPAVLKSSQNVTLLGRTSGGGSCAVQPLSTAYGTLFQISGRLRLSFLKNGSFYDIDQGVDPDYYIDDISHYYDRAALTDFINGLFSGPDLSEGGSGFPKKEYRNERGCLSDPDRQPLSYIHYFRCILSALPYVLGAAQAEYDAGKSVKQEEEQPVQESFPE